MSARRKHLRRNADRIAADQLQREALARKRGASGYHGAWGFTRNGEQPEHVMDESGLTPVVRRRREGEVFRTVDQWLGR